MKIAKYLSLLIALFCFEFGFSQKNKSSKENIGISASHFFNIDRNAVNGSAFTTEIVYSKNKNNFSIGPVWWIDKIKDVSPFRGGIFSYKYFVLNDKSKVFNFYFNTDLIYTFEKEYWRRYEDFDIAPRYSMVEFTSKSNSIKMLIGYGFNINITPKFYLYNQMDIGIEFYNYDSFRQVENYPEFTVKYSSGGILESSKSAAIMKLGICYHF